MYSWVTLQHLAQWTQGVLTPANVSLPVRAISSDTRSLQRGDVFIALKGENFDGHAYLKKAEELGASLVIAEKELPLQCPILVVKDTLQAYVHIGQALREAFQGPVVAVTGSAGKSSTRDMIAVLLGEHTLKAPASYNNLLGVSKTLCLLEEHHQKLVLEVGMNHLGEIREICEAFRPTAGLITNVGDAHIGFLGSQENIFQAKKELFEFLGRSPLSLGVALNADDPYVQRAWKETIPASLQTVTYSAQGMKADVCLLEKNIDPATCELRLKLDAMGQIFSASCKLFGLHHAQNIAAAVAMASLLGVDPKEIGKRLAQVTPAPHRGELTQFGEGMTLVDESYNSNPSALKSSLASLSHLDPSRRRILVIGEMRELGEFSKKLHCEAARDLLHALKKVQSKTPCMVISVGNDAEVLHEELLQHSSSLVLQHTDHFSAALEAVKKELHPLDILFVKGSHGVRLDLLVDSLKNHFKISASSH